MRLSPFLLTAGCLLWMNDALAIPHSEGPSIRSISLVRTNPRQSNNCEPSGSFARRHRLALEAKYGVENAHRDGRRESGTNLLINQGLDTSFLGTVAIGTPPVLFAVIMDTGSSDLWIAGEDSDSDTRTDLPGGIPIFNPSASSTFQNLDDPFSIQYESGSADGILVKDTVQMAGFELPSQTFALVNSVSSDVLIPPSSGILGLGWENIASSNSTPFWQALAQTNGTLTDPLFAMQLTRYKNDSEADQLEPGGTFTLGATNSSLFTGKIDYQDIPNGELGYWLQELSALTVQGKQIPLQSGSASYAAIDTGTTLVAGPADAIAEIYAQIPGSAPGTGEYSKYYTYPCFTTVEITLKFGNSSIAWPIAPIDFAFASTGDPAICLGAFIEVELPVDGPGAPVWIIGDTFLKNVYSVFRYNPPAVGFAKLSTTALAMNGEDQAIPSNNSNAASSVSRYPHMLFWTIAMISAVVLL